MQEMEMTILIINVVSLLLAGIGLLAALLALGFALLQVWNARRISKLGGDIIALEAFLTVELAGQKDRKLIQKLLELIFVKVMQIGSMEILEIKDILKDRYVNKETF